MLGNYIQYLRKREGVGRETLAGRAGLTLDELVHIEEDNVKMLPTPRLLKIADALHLKKADDFASLMQFNGAVRRFQAYCIGLPKTGTTSLAGIFGGYRSAHEFQQWNTHQAITAFRNGRASRSEFRTFILDRDKAGGLEMDAAHFNRHYVDILADEFPNAVFIYLIRDPFSWLDSMINYVTSPKREALQSGELPNGMPFDLPKGECEAKTEITRNFHRYIDWPLSFWARENRTMLTTLPPGRSLIVRTHEIVDTLARMADLTGAPEDTLLEAYAHLNRATYRVKILDLYTPGFLKDKFDRHCGDLSAECFPGYRLDDFFNGNPIPPHPGWH